MEIQGNNLKLGGINSGFPDDLYMGLLTRPAFGARPSLRRPRKMFDRKLGRPFFSVPTGDYVLFN